MCGGERACGERRRRDGEWRKRMVCGGEEVCGKEAEE
jgi:hypothetical protein